MTNKASEHTTNGGSKKVTSVRGGTFEHSIASIICQVKFSTYENARILTINNGCSSSLDTPIGYTDEMTRCPACGKQVAVLIHDVATQRRCWYCADDQCRAAHEVWVGFAKRYRSSFAWRFDVDAKSGSQATARS